MFTVFTTKCVNIKVATSVLVVIASLLVAGCTVNVPLKTLPSTSTTLASNVTRTPNPDYSAVLTKEVESTNFIMERPFTKSTNTRGNDIYKGVGRNATMPDSPSVTLTLELVETKAEAKQVFDKEVAVKLDDGYVYSSKETAEQKDLSPSVVEGWYGNRGNSWFWCGYRYDTKVLNYIVFTQAS